MSVMNEPPPRNIHCTHYLAKIKFLSLMFHNINTNETTDHHNTETQQQQQHTITVQIYQYNINKQEQREGKRKEKRIDKNQISIKPAVCVHSLFGVYPPKGKGAPTLW